MAVKKEIQDKISAFKVGHKFFMPLAHEIGVAKVLRNDFTTTLIQVRVYFNWYDHILPCRMILDYNNEVKSFSLVHE